MPLSTIPHVPVTIQDNILGKQPSIWFGTAAVGTVTPWAEAAVGSLYCDRTGGTATWYFRRLAANAVASWGTVSFT